MRKPILVLTAMVMLLPSSMALAYEPWDAEDPCVASNEDFMWGAGADGGTWEAQQGQQPLPVGQPPYPNDGFNLYRDDATGTGNLDIVRIFTLTPDEIDLPSKQEFVIWYGDDYWKMYGENPDTWYWALHPRRYNPSLPTPEDSNRYKGLGGVFWVEVFNFGGFDTYKWNDWSSVNRVIRDAVIATGKITGVNAVKCILYIPEGTHLSYPNRLGVLVTNLMLEFENGEVYFSPQNVDFSQPCTIRLAYPDGFEEIIGFTQIRDGRAIGL